MLIPNFVHRPLKKTNLHIQTEEEQLPEKNDACVPTVVAKDQAVDRLINSIGHRKRKMIWTLCVFFFNYVRVG